MKVKIIQLAINDGENKFDRLLRVESILDKINSDTTPPSLIILPEIWATGFFNFNRYLEESESIEGEIITRLSEKASTIKAYILAGSIVEKYNNKFYNTAVMINPEGNVVDIYRKIHLFGYNSSEQQLLTPGNKISILKSDLGCLGITTCYDLRFPELYRSMVDLGVEMFLVVSAWPLSRLNHWKLLNQVRALENQCWLIACNCCGEHNNNVLAGHSMIVNPWGEVELQGEEKEDILDYVIDMTMVKEIRSQFPALTDRVIRYNVTRDLP